MNDHRPLYWPLLVNGLALTIVGLVCLWSIYPLSQHQGGSLMRHYFVKQCVFLAVCFGALWFTLWIPSSWYRKYAYVAWFFGIALLLGLYVAGREVNGARRWYSFAGFSAQPSEFVKVAVVLTLARMMEDRRHIQSFLGFLFPFAIVGIPMLIILKQPDLGTVMLFCPTLMMMLYIAGARLKHIILIVVIGMVILPFGFMYGLHAYQRARVVAFLDPDNAPLKDRYQIDRSLTAISSGGLTGSDSTEAGYWAVVPEKHTDFIFSVIGEEWGFAGTTLIIALYLAFFILAFRLAASTSAAFNRLVIVGLTTFIASQVFINVGMTIGLAPITGLTLPFISYGGSSLLAMFSSLGIMLAVGKSNRTDYGRGEIAELGGQISGVGASGFVH